MALMKLCPICGRKIPYNQKHCERCAAKVAERKANATKQYDKTVRKSDSNKQYDKFYHSQEWLKARAVAVVRDKGLCVDCLAKGIITPYHTVHHITEIKDDWSKRLDVNNLVCLCESCHQKRHSDMRR